MGYNLADLPQIDREQVQAEKVAAYLAWQEQQGQLSAAQLDQQVSQQPESQRQYCLTKLAKYRQRLAVVPL